jgi:hypothetical protein
VLPVVQLVEWFVNAAEGCRPGQRVARLLDFRILSGVQLQAFDDAGDAFVVRCVPSENAGGTTERLQLTLLDAAGTARCSATVEMGSGDANPPVFGAAPTEQLSEQPSYSDGALFHGPAFQVIERLAWLGTSSAVAQLHGLTRAGWLQQSWSTDPAALDGCLQLGFLWGLQHTGNRMLPLQIGEIIRYGSGPAEGSLYCHLDNHESDTSRIVCDLRLTDASGAVITEFKTVEMYAYGN